MYVEFGLLLPAEGENRANGFSHRGVAQKAEAIFDVAEVGGSPWDEYFRICRGLIGKVSHQGIVALPYEAMHQQAFEK